MSFYNYTAKDIRGNEIAMDSYRGKVVLVVNTASKCGFTPQLKELEQLHQTYKNQGLEILGFPCNQFANQDPGSNDQIYYFCQLNYGVTFPMFGRIDVNGSNAHPIFKYLRSKKKGIFGDNVKWNFTKFLIDGEGNVIQRYAPTVAPSKIEKKIKQLLPKK